MAAGKVWLLGAGPGDVGLLTEKGAAALERAEVVVYDSLVGQGILCRIPENAVKINVGKRAACHTVPQEEINQILLEQAEKGLRVVRLKGGDPFLFGRGGEELEILSRRGIPFEVIPGVASALAVPAYNGIPVTHRDFSSSLHIITGHKKAGELYDIDFEALVRTKGTLVFLMGVAALEEICGRLLEAGMDPGMPAAILQQGTTAGQKRVLASVGTLPAEAGRQKIAAPAVIVVGKVCALASELAWYEKLPLAGCKVVVTRPREWISAMAAKLREKGAEVLELPAIRIEAGKAASALRQIFPCLGQYQWIVFTSPTGVRVFFEEMQRAKCDVRRLYHAKIAAIGPGTQKALAERGLQADLMPKVYDGENLAAALAGQIVPGAAVLIPRAEAGNPRLTEILEQAGARVEDVSTYQTACETQEVVDLAREFEDGRIYCAVFTSASTVRGFASACPELDFGMVRAACIGKQTCAEARKYGMQTWTAREATMDSLTELVISMRQEETEISEAFGCI